ncbi:hypothetical protein JHK82_041426 [Glycine max]|uniref:EKN n=1 Tax=Glycine soja TaxID=3848 RepID=A0A445GPI6_GLYSO|nr:uncharacterized protein LOC114386612 [Glycine soja]XP_040865808.1 uncharacterized protein LOC121173605 [Glycine max]KAG4945368.1 hypothetical protein JHK87_041375 [Glycine soja]KAG4948244.1 hypothetical protein JHK86_041483 [Glycine max]KAG4955711.1 hypothetical protein JHK85_042091 [Glycine max]KAG5104456.1 hypothetical protein JHK82_041426 [Glycine max]KAG5115579.1 hypothetical protein JHK84_041692 [Glycine max]
MGNCASYPKTNEGEAPVPVPVPEPVAEEVKVEQQENKAEENVVEAKTEETPVASADNSLVTLLNENEEKKEEQFEAKEVKAEAPKEEKAQAEDAKPETNEEKPAAKAEN